MTAEFTKGGLTVRKTATHAPQNRAAAVDLEGLWPSSTSHSVTGHGAATAHGTLVHVQTAFASTSSIASGSDCGKSERRGVNRGVIIAIPPPDDGKLSSKQRKLIGS